MKKALIYKTLIKPIRSYSILLRNCARPSNTKAAIKNLKDFSAPWNVSNKTHETKTSKKVLSNFHTRRKETHVCGWVIRLNAPAEVSRKVNKKCATNLNHGKTILLLMEVSLHGISLHVVYAEQTSWEQIVKIELTKKGFLFLTLAKPFSFVWIFTVHKTNKSQSVIVYSLPVSFVNSWFL